MNLEVHPTAFVHKDAEISGKGSVFVGAYSTIKKNCILSLGNNKDSVISIGSRSKIKTGSIIKCYGGVIEIGDRVTVGEYSVLAGHGGIKIGDSCIFGPYVMLNSASHIISGTSDYRFQGELAKGIRVGRNVWIGARCTVLDDVVIEDGAVIGAHSLVNKNVRERTITFGSPAVERKTISVGENK